MPEWILWVALTLSCFAMAWAFVPICKGVHAWIMEPARKNESRIDGPHYDW